MMVSEALLEKLSDILNRARGGNLIPSPPQPTQIEVEQRRLKAQGQWVSAIASLETLLLSDAEDTPQKTPLGLIISAPTPILCHPHLTKTLHTGIFTLQHPHHSYQQFQLPGVSEDPEDRKTSNLTELPIFPQDPLATEQFCLVLTPKFPLLMVLGEDS